MFGKLTVRPHYITLHSFCAPVCMRMWCVGVVCGCGGGWVRGWVFCGLGVVCKEHNIIFRYYFEVIFKHTFIFKIDVYVHADLAKQHALTLVRDIQRYGN